MTSIHNLKLRSVLPGDFKIYYQLVKDPGVARGASFRPVKSVHLARQRFEEDLKSSQPLAVTLGHRMIGVIMLYPTIGADSGPNYASLELADMMLPAFQGHHYMTRAIRMLVRKLKKSSRVKQLVALVSEDNPASRKVLLNNHFVNYRSVLDMNSGHENLIYQLSLK